jgi:hypothetical protein
MSRRKRVLVTFIVIEMVLAGIWVWLHLLASDPARVNRPDAQAHIGQIMGMVMGALFGVGAVLYFVSAAADRKKAADTQDVFTD